MLLECEKSINVNSININKDLVVTEDNYGATNCIHNIKMYANKFVVYAKFLEAIQNFVCQCNILLLPFVYFDPTFFIGWKLFVFIFVYLNLLIWMFRQCLIIPLLYLQSPSNLLYQHFLFFLDNNFFFFNHASELTHMQIHLILNQT